MNCPNGCSGDFITERGLKQHQRIKRCSSQPSRFYFFAANVEVTIGGKRFASAREISYDSTKDTAPVVRGFTSGLALPGLIEGISKRMGED